MARSSFKKRKIRAKTPRVYGGAGATRKLNPPKPAEQTDNNPPDVSHQKLEFTNIDLAPEPGQTPQGIEHVKPEQESPPLIKASDLFTFTKRTLSAEARELLAKVDEGGIPLIVTQNLERIAKEHGIEISRKMTPNDIVRRLRHLA
jgi:hypothetical protein